VNEKLVVVLSRLLDLEDDKNHLLKPVRKLQPEMRKGRGSARQLSLSESSADRRR
jgi:hypothetical protein